MSQAQANEEALIKEQTAEEAVWGPERFEAEFDLLVRYLMAFGLSREDAQDSAQETLVKDWQRRDEPRSCRQAWLSWVARNDGRDLIRRQRTATNHRKGIEQAAKLVAVSAADEAELRESAERLQEKVDALPPNLRDIVRLRWAGESTETIAQLLGLSQRAIQRRLQDARKLLAIEGVALSCYGP